MLNHSPRRMFPRGRDAAYERPRGLPVCLGFLEEERLLDSDEAYAEWYAWAKREISPDPAVCVGAAQAALQPRVEVLESMPDDTAGGKSPAGRAVLLAQRVSDLRRAYAEWFDWA